ncbi:MAG: FliA/WhiG family RNA polymerase sigma factor, partial [Lentisphaerota bacterium]
HQQSDEAISDLIENYLPFVHRVLERLAIHLPSHVALEDLLQAALVGLFQAIEHFDPHQGVAFEAFAYRRIRGAILDELRAADRISRSNRAQVRKIEQAIRLWAQEHGSAPGEDDLAGLVGMTSEALNLLLDRAQPWLSLDEMVLEGDSRSVPLKEVIADPRAIMPDQAAQKGDLNHCLHKAFLQLTSREQKILYLYYYEELRLSEIAALYDLTEARICQLHALALAKLRAVLGRDAAL